MILFETIRVDLLFKLSHAPGCGKLACGLSTWRLFNWFLCSETLRQEIIPMAYVLIMLWHLLSFWMVLKAPLSIQRWSITAAVCSEWIFSSQPLLLWLKLNSSVVRSSNSDPGWVMPSLGYFYHTGCEQFLGFIIIFLSFFFQKELFLYHFNELVSCFLI